eukprot:TRINITY_DN92_c0_g1_i2.p1 TRINITY_DN92_c0_g1~~TRINITY_DN92_c0_g1_i2.p1  ORF type:complete len:308 (-),score=69.00 TRINITY_DN92_c0_g1_i2:74-973(-)
MSSPTEPPKDLEQPNQLPPIYYLSPPQYEPSQRFHQTCNHNQEFIQYHRRLKMMLCGFVFMFFLLFTLSLHSGSYVQYVWTSENGTTPVPPPPPPPPPPFPFPGTPLVNLDFAKANIKTYYSSGRYDSDLWELANFWFSQLLNPSFRNATNRTVVFDVDDTVLANYPEMVATDFGYIPKIFDAWVQSANASAIQQTKWLYERVLHEGYTVIFLTGRKDTQANATLNNLQRVGFTQFSQLITRNSTEYSLTAEQYKSQRRKSLTDQGYNIIGCVGDQFSDCTGGYTVYAMKVPNFCYYIA